MTTASDKAPGPSRESRYFSTCPSLRPLHIVHACLQSEHRASCLIQSSLIVATALRTAVSASDFGGPQRTLAFGLDAGGKLIGGSRIATDRAIRTGAGATNSGYLTHAAVVLVRFNDSAGRPFGVYGTEDSLCSPGVLALEFGVEARPLDPAVLNNQGQEHHDHDQRQ